MSRGVIISACPVSASLASALRPGDTIIACDAGYRNCAPLHCRPDIIVGDFDTAPCPAQEGVSERGSFYELTDAVLTAGYPLGVSNEYADGSDCITISTQKGALVVVETVPDGPILS